MKKWFLFFVLTSFCFFYNTVRVSAVILSLYDDCDGVTCGDGTVTIVNSSNCVNGSVQYCNKNEACGVGVCGANSSGCCSLASSWTKYIRSCGRQLIGGRYSYAWFWSNWGTQCSTADKCIAGESGLRAGYCECGTYSGSMYKVCCNNVTGALAGSCVNYSSQDGSYPPEGVCPSGSHSVFVSSGGCCTPNCSNAPNVCSGATFDNGCGGNCTGTRPTSYPTSGTCGLPSSQIFSSVPTSSLCSSGSASVVTTNVSTYSWTCTGSAGSCPDTSGGVANCSVVKDSVPSLVSFDIRNTSNTSVPAETGGRNHICQSSFTNDSIARFVVTYSDTQGGTDISRIDLGIDGGGYNKTYFKTGVDLTVSGNNATAVFDVPKTDITSTAVLNLYIRGYDKNEAASFVSTPLDTNRDFKYWDCNVSITGTGYDGSATSSSCSDASFTGTVVDPYTLMMNNVSGGANQNMAVISPNYSGSLFWGQSYLFNPTIGGSNFKLRFNNSTATCTNSLQFAINNIIADPYATSVSSDVDFTSVLDQDPWWQASGGGVISNNLVNDRVPVTCTTSNCKINPTGLVSSKSIFNPNRNIPDIQTWFYSTPNATLASYNSNYGYFYDQYYVKNSTGTVLSGNKVIADITGSASGVYFVDGNLTIDANKTVAPGSFLMIIVKGDITIANTVTGVDGILVANNINATGTNANQLVLNGSLYASNNVDFSRSYTNKRNNNTSPAVVVNHNPQMIFNLPGSVAKVLTSWQWGN